VVSAQSDYDFFVQLHQQFTDTINQHHNSERLLPALLGLAFSSYEGTVELQSADQPKPVCGKGCATCCSIRVVASAPEVFLVARYIRAVEKSLKEQGIDIRQRLEEADQITRGQDQQQRVNQRQTCPYIHNGACVIYSVRPLACRSHMSYDRQACIDAAAGQINEIPYSDLHMNVRSLVQNALQSALRDADYPWASYELNHALQIALDDEDSEFAWLASQDVLAPALVKDVSLDEMGEAFDAIHGQKS